MFSLAWLAACSSHVRAETANAGERHEGWNGTAGFGPIVFPKYTGGKGSRVWPIPLLSIDYDETFYVEIQRVGVYVLASDDKKIGLGLAAEPRFGFSGGDGSRVTGMATRRDSLEAGLTFDWDFDVVAFSVAWFNDVNRTSRGRSARASVYKPVVKDEHWDMGVLLGYDRMDKKISNCFFGVTPNEATTARPMYQATASGNGSLGFSGTYKLDKKNALMFGANITRLGGSAAASPIVETRRATMVYLGYGWSL
jgi:outer membrane protein